MANPRGGGVTSTDDSVTSTGPAALRLVQALLDMPRSLRVDVSPEDLARDAAVRLEELLGHAVTLRWADEVGGEPPRSADRLKLRLRHQDEPFAMLEVTAAGALPAEVTWALAHLAHDLTSVIDASSTRRLRGTLRALRDAMSSAPDLGAFTASAVDLAARFVDADAAMLLLGGPDGPAPLATLGAWDLDDAAVARRRRIAFDATHAPGPFRLDDGLVAVPIASSPPARCVLLLRFAAERRLHSLSLPLLTELASVAAPFLDARWRDSVLTELLELNNASEETSTTEMYGRVLRTALRLVPGADGGTLLTRTDPDAPFVYRAAEGFDLEQLRENPITEAAARAWYGEESPGWHQGLPRILHREDADIERLGAASTPDTDPDVTNYHLIQSTLCLPVLRDGKVMAVLNLDDLHQGGGLARDSSQLAYLFGAPLASLLHRQQTRDVLRRAALTDELTGLANRRAFDQALERELTRAARGGVGPSVLLMDLKEFKAVNDRFGHAKGDEVLVAVGTVLRRSLRAVDLAARRGGDEFLGLLVDTPASEAERVKERIERKVAELDTGLGALHINVGVASHELDGGDPDRLLRLADSRMYEAKRAAKRS